MGIHQIAGAAATFVTGGFQELKKVASSPAAKLLAGNGTGTGGLKIDESGTITDTGTFKNDGSCTENVGWILNRLWHRLFKMTKVAPAPAVGIFIGTCTGSGGFEINECGTGTPAPDGVLTGTGTDAGGKSDEGGTGDSGYA